MSLKSSQTGFTRESSQNMRVRARVCVRARGACVCVCELQQSSGGKYLSRQFGTEDVTELHAHPRCQSLSSSSSSSSSRWTQKPPKNEVWWSRS